MHGARVDDRSLRRREVHLGDERERLIGLSLQVLLAAVGLGFAFVTTTIAAVSGIEDHEQGLASGLINTSQQVGGALGLAVLETVANSRTDDVLAAAGGNPRALPDALVEGFQSAFLGAALIAVIGLVLTLILIRSSDSRAHVELSKKVDAVTVAV